MYFDGSSLLTPVINLHSSKSKLALVGLVISHAYISTGILPTRISFPCLAGILLPKPGDLPDNIMAEIFMNGLSLYDATVIRQGMEWSAEKEFSNELQTSMIAILSAYDCREVPKHTIFKCLIAEIARHHFVRKPAAIITDMHAGVPSLHTLFWSKVTGGMLYDIYRSMTATNGQVLSMIANTMPMKRESSAIYALSLAIYVKMKCFCFYVL